MFVEIHKMCLELLTHQLQCSIHSEKGNALYASIYDMGSYNQIAEVISNLLTLKRNLLLTIIIRYMFADIKYTHLQHEEFNCYHTVIVYNSTWIHVFLLLAFLV